MLILIAESKTMTRCDRPVDSGLLSERSPLLGQQADHIMDSLRDVPEAELAAKVKISGALAHKLRQMIYEFADKTLGDTAINAFTGVVFKALDYPSLSAEAQSRCCGRVRIISSLYGWLRPLDIVRPYRLDFTTSLAPNGGSFASFLKPSVTSELLKYLNETGCTEILDLMPADAAKCIDAGTVGKEAAIWKVEFREILPGGKSRTPNAGRLKTLRGKLLRQLLETDINDISSLAGLESDDYIFDSVDADKRIVTFHTA